jgi:hypothetical protein
VRNRPQGTPTVTPTCQPAWRVVPSPNFGPYDNYLDGVAALSADDVWAVGYYGGQTLVEHWDGSSWSIVPSPNPGTTDSWVQGVAAINPNNVWAVGAYTTDGSEQVTLTIHWDGNSWSVVPSPNVGPGLNILYSVAALSQHDIWAAGVHCTGIDFTGCQTLTMHGDGGSWSIVPSPNVPGHDSILYYEGLSGSKHNDMWAVGFYCVTSDCSVVQSLAEHWDGTAWSIVPSPNPGSAYTWFSGVVAVTPNDAWADGSYTDDYITWSNLVEHWDGRAWRVVSAPSPGAADNDLHGMAATGPNHVWAVGDTDNGSGERTQAQRYGHCH